MLVQINLVTVIVNIDMLLKYLISMKNRCTDTKTFLSMKNDTEKNEIK